MQRHTSLIPPAAVAVALWLTVASATLALTPEERAEVIKSCAGCHGEDGIGRDEYPNLAGQKKAYLVAAMKAYRDRKRDVESMYPWVRDLSDEDIASIAEHYAEMPAGGVVDGN